MSRAAIAGDIAGSRFERSRWEGDKVRNAHCVAVAPGGASDWVGEEAAAFELFHPASHPTDDTVLTVAVMDWILHGGDPRAALRAHFRQSARPELFGRYFRAWAAADTDAPCGSVGNGAAMRAVPIGHASTDATEVIRLARENACATHATDDAVAGAEAVALGVYLARTGIPRSEIASEIASRYHYNLARTLDDWRPGYRFTSACGETLPVAFRAFLEADCFEAAIRAAVSVGGDADTIACVAGGLAGAYWGIPHWVSDHVMRALTSDMLRVLFAFEAKFPSALRVAAGADTVPSRQ